MNGQLLFILGAIVFCVIMILATYATNKSTHPKALFLLFFTEMWERFSFYGMRALLMLYMTSQLHYPDKQANLTYGTYTALVYLMPLFGGMIADKILGYRRAIVLGGILMAIGHFVLALPPSWSFFTGMAFLISGNGFFKPNISTMVGRLYPDGDNRRDGAFSIFYMGVNIGAFLSSLICGYIGQKGSETFSFMTPENSWHYGFGLAGVFMVLGLINFLSFKNLLGDIGLTPQSKSESTNNNTKSYAVYFLSLLIIPVFIFLFKNYTLMGYIMYPVFILATMYCILLAEHPEQEIQKNSLIQFSIVYAIYVVIFLSEPIFNISLNPVLFSIGDFTITLLLLYLIFLIGFLIFKSIQYVKKNEQYGGKQITAVVLVTFSIMFWAFYEQGGGSLNLFADRNVNMLGMGAAAVNNSINPLMVILLSTPFAGLWLFLSKRGKEPSTPTKFGLSFVQLGAGFLLFVVGAKLATSAGQVSFTWFVLGYILLTTGELCLSPIGLSMISKLSPPKITGMMMGFWFLASAMGQYLAGVVGTMMAIPSEGGATTVSAVESLAIYSGVFMKIFYVSLGGGLVLLLLVPILKRWMGAVK
ncbi:MAG: peptide MFS transporter [Sphingobacteriales bacterium]|nr:peptide MFS transporter [Sphingobacteriales bacterium]MBP8192495.1 peptide MFS transporter [Chitinophagales bacterium]